MHRGGDRRQEGVEAGRADRWEIFTHGGRNPTGIDAVAYAREVVALGAGEILLTSMDRDGTRQGFDIALTRAIADAVPVPVIASGGVGNLDHLVEGIRDGHATAVLAASIFHFGEYSVREAKEHMARAGLPMRLDPVICNPIAVIPDGPRYQPGTHVSQRQRLSSAPGYVGPGSRYARPG